jgi:hypothetical protein
MSKGIDYSKWDKIDCSSSDSDDEHQHQQQQPRVTRLDAPSTITRTADGDLIVDQQQSQPQKPAATEARPPAAAASSAGKSSAVASTTSTSLDQKIEDWSQNGGVVTTESGCHLYWSQDRYSVCLRLELLKSNTNRDIKGKELTVDIQGMLPFKDRYQAVGKDHTAHLTLIWNNPATKRSEILLEGDFPHAVHATEDGELDWDIDRLTEHESNKEVSYCTITVQKAVPMQGVILWWRRPLTQFDEIDARQANTDDASKAKAFQNAWEEAHKQFREKMQQKKNADSGT